MFAIRQLSHPENPAEVRACLDAAETGAVVIERDGEALIVITPVKEYESLSALDDLAKTTKPASASESAYAD